MTEPLYVVSLPSGSFTAKDEVKEYVSALNASILRGSNYVHPVDVRLIIGDPNYAFTDTVAEMLVEIGILTKEPVKNKHGKQKKLQGKELPEEQRVRGIMPGAKSPSTIAVRNNSSLLGGICAAMMDSLPYARWWSAP